MMTANPRFLAPLAPFDPLAGQVLREPPGAGPGYWAGAPGVYRDHTGVYYLTYRIRRPRGVQPDRGAEMRLATSADGLQFTDRWTLRKEELGSTSIERCCLTQAPDGRYLLYISYVDPDDQRWRIDVLDADHPEQFQADRRRPVLTADDLGVDGVKDPWVINLGGAYHMVLSYATAIGAVDDDVLHESSDAYNTGLVRSRTGLATSIDGIEYAWQGDMFSPTDDGWDSYAARVSCLWHRPPVWIGFYDGSASVKENYEERCGLAVGTNPYRLLRVSQRGPWVTTPHATGSVRYLDVLPEADRTLFYYEMVRPDGAHELRVHAVSAD